MSHFFSQTHRVSSWPGAFCTWSSQPWVQADKHVAVLYRDCRPCLHITSVRCLSATATTFMQKMQEHSATKVCPGQTQIPCSHLHKVSHTVRQSVQEGAPEELNKPSAQKPNLWLARSCVGGRVWQEGTLSVSLMDLRFLSDPVVTEKLAHNTENKEFISLSFFEPM